MTNLVDYRGRPRVVITGMGAVTSLGLSVVESWESVLVGRSGIGRITHFDPSNLPCQIAGEVTGFDPHTYLPRKEARRMSRASQLAIAALRMAQLDAGLPEQMPNPEQTGVMIGTSFSGIDKLDESLHIQRTRGWSRVNPFAVSSSLVNMTAHHVSVAARTFGPIGTQVAACASGVQAVGEGAELIRRYAAQTVIVGGVDCTVHEGAMAGFCAMRALPTTYNDDPTRASRPFDAQRSGFLIGEGAAILILESLEHALARGAQIQAEFLGHASSSDAYHMATPDPEAAGAVRAMQWALRDANLAPTEIDYINAHGTGTPLNDKGETLAIKHIWGEAAHKTPISSTKGVMGHAMGASGAIETIFCAQALQTGILPPTWNLDHPDPECDLDYVPYTPRTTDPQTALCNGFGLGGQNATLILGKSNAEKR